MTEEKKEKVEEVVEAPVQEEKQVVEAAAEEKTEAVVEETKEVVEVEVAKEEEAPVTTAKIEEEFDWASLESGVDAYSASERGDFESLYFGTLNTVSEKEVLEGTVISLNKREVVVDIGYKSDGIVSLNEFRYNPELKIGDKV
ncbi:MAG: S1 RNA-binding domain-containing protein, partial [Bacteroidetes bacterium]|nr:S1 RNA-binding domain-containing protein [Bacteroidota bacterium]